MKPADIGNLYSKIASWWNDEQNSSVTGIVFVRRAIELSIREGSALDVGCGNGRISALLLNSGFKVTGIDVSTAMLEHAAKNCPEACFVEADICEWSTEKSYDLIIAWDSIFHVPYLLQNQVVAKLCNFLAKNGVLLFTVGGVDGEITGEMQGQEFYYSSLTEIDYLKILKENGCKCILMQRDQYPEEHLIFIVIKE